MFCRHCRTQVPDGVTFCPVCGREIKESLPLLKRFFRLFQSADKSSGKNISHDKKHKKKRPAKRN